MATATATMHMDFALDVYGLLRELDPKHWKGEEDAPFQHRLEGLRKRMADLLKSIEELEPNPALESIRSGLLELRQVLESHAPPAGMYEAWQEFRSAVAPLYEGYAASLRQWDIHVPSLRPTNYARNAFHVTNSLIGMSLLLVLTPHQVIWAAAFMMVLAWSLEISRRIFPGWNDILMALLGRLAHPHEAWRVNSATWFCTACFILASTGNPEAATVGLAVLGFGDPAAAVIGRRFGRIRLVNGRTVIGSTAFVIVGTIAASAWLMLTWDMPVKAALGMAVYGSVFGALAELFSRRIDDNLSIPVVATLAALLV